MKTVSSPSFENGRHSSLMFPCIIYSSQWGPVQTVYKAWNPSWKNVLRCHIHSDAFVFRNDADTRAEAPTTGCRSFVFNDSLSFIFPHSLPGPRHGFVVLYSLPFGLGKVREEHYVPSQWALHIATSTINMSSHSDESDNKVEEHESEECSVWLNVWNKNVLVNNGCIAEIPQGSSNLVLWVSGFI